VENGSILLFAKSAKPKLLRESALPMSDNSNRRIIGAVKMILHALRA
jgi:hypothetical protein